MKNRTIALRLLLVVGFRIYALTRYALNIPADKRGNDAIDYVILHGSVQHEHPVSPARPTDVTGVYIHEGYANKTMIDLLHYLPNLRHITIGPDFSGVYAGTPASQMPKPSEAAASDVTKMRAAFPDLNVRAAHFAPQSGR